MLDGDERRWSGQIAIPKVVPYGLKMPDALAGFGVQRNKRVRKQIVAQAIRAIEIESSRTGWGENDSALDVEAHARPVVHAADILPGIFRPGIVAEFAGVRNGVKR